MTGAGEFTLFITPSARDALVSDAQQCYPQEACGFLVGHHNRIEFVIPAKNTASDPRLTFEIDRQAFESVLPEIRSAGQTLIGFYHSHPDAKPVPSYTDVENAQPHFMTVHLIVGLLAGQDATLAAWRISPAEVHRLDLHLLTDIAVQAPPSDLDGVSPILLTVSAVTAVLLVLFLAVQLLPPPPVP